MKGIMLSEEKAMAPHSSTLAWKIPWTEEPGRLQSVGSRRVRHDESNLARRSMMYDKGDCPEKAMATHSSTFAWKIPWTEEPGGLQSMGLLRVGYD